MRKKQLIVAFIIMILLAVGSWLSRDKNLQGTLVEGDLIFEDVETNKIQKVTISTAKANVEVELQKNRWVVKNRFGIDADPSIIRNMVKFIREAKAVQVVKYSEKDLNTFNLGEYGTTLKVFCEGREEPFVYKFGKEHIFSAKEKQFGRYIFVENKKSIALVPGQLSYITGFPHVWVKKYLPYHEQMAAITFYNKEKAQWKVQRNHPKGQFQLLIPNNVKKSNQELSTVINNAVQLRYMDVRPALNDFEPDEDLSGQSIQFDSYSGRSVRVEFLKRDGLYMRCRLELISQNAKSGFTKEFGSDELLKDEMRSYHFNIFLSLYEELVKFK